MVPYNLYTGLASSGRSPDRKSMDTKMIKVAVCDDDREICWEIKKQVLFVMQSFGKECQVECYGSSSALLQAPLDFQILLLDIELPDSNGIHTALTLRQSNWEFALIFITSHEEFVFQAFETDAVDYICKPLDQVRFQKALGRAISKLQKPPQQEKYLFIKTINWCKFVRLSSIYYCEVRNRKIYLYTHDGIIDYYCKIRDLEQQLDKRFVKCHRSYLVNLDYLKEYAHGWIRLENGDCLPVSRLRHQEFLDAIMKYMKSREK